MNLVLFVFPLLLSGLLGSIPSAYLVGKCRGIDIRNYGSGNMGATNTMRVLGRRWGFFVLGADVLKGFMACWFVSFAWGNLGAAWGHWGAVLGGVIAFITHDWNPWFKFKPVGKGVSCALGSALFAVPIAMLIGLVSFLLTVFISRYISLASLNAALTVLILSFVFATPTPYRIFVVVAVCFIVLRHKENLKRLRAGTEPRLQWGKKEIDN
ncbi:MAG: glycerol-3-phosphate 1-O-acyltransferase PlsY [Gracilibacteraceae bacterium]|jgi:glycerol-3-phosphate acyltransferase PlsY|nr:glycerol-3-phosphate 1-O-acyltransferase PlsY [Gracilibacteraceae bacterium]